MVRKSIPWVAGAAAALAGVVALQSLPPEWFREEAEAAVADAEEKMWAEASERGGPALVWTFDGARPREWSRMGGTFDGAWPGTTAVPGLHGEARRFSGRDDCFYQTGRTWEGGAGDYTVGMWVKTKEFPRRQDLMMTAEGGWGFHLEEERICFDVPLAAGGVETASAPFGGRGKWTHIAFARDRAVGESRLWVDGERVATTGWNEALDRGVDISFGVASPLKVRYPFHGELDEAAIWERALDDAEVRSLARDGESLAEKYGTARARRRLARRQWELRGREALAWLRTENWGWSRGGADKLRSVGLSFADGAWRHLSKTQARSRASGCLSPGAAKPVDAVLSLDGTAVRVRVSVFGGATHIAGGERPAYSVLPLDPCEPLPGGARRWVLVPPESGGWLGPLAWAAVAEETGLPVAAPCEAVRLRCNGLERGVYLLRDFSRCGAVAGLETPCDRRLDLGRQVRHERWWVEPSGTETPRTVAGAVRTFLDEAAKRKIDDRLKTLGRAVEWDVFSPLPRMERHRRMRASQEAFKWLAPGPAPADEALLDETLLAGGNASAWRVAEDVPLAAVAARVPPGAKLEFRSLAPEWMDDSGRVAARPAKTPVEVPVEALYRAPDGAERRANLRFRVMPESWAVPTLCIWAGVPADKLRREDASVEWFDAGEVDNGPDRVWSATAATRGGFRFRGNSSFIGPRRLFSLKLDVPHGLFPGSPTRLLEMINGGTDAVKIADALAFEAYRSFPRGNGQRNVAPRVLWADVYMNGRYFGLQEFCERVDEDVLGEGEWTVFRHETVPPRDPYVKPKRPAPAEGDFTGPLVAVESLFAEEKSPGWAARAEELLDLDSFVDYQLLNNLFGNLNGVPKPWVFDDIAVWDGSRGKIVYVPWDFDVSLNGGPVWIETDADRRLWRDFPGHPERVAARWRELRATCLSPELLRARAEEMFAGIEDALEWDWMAWPPDFREWGGVSGARDILAMKLDWLEARVKEMDERFGL